jgi:hypothetical protein
MKHLKLFIENKSMPSIFTKQVVYSVDCSDLASFIEDLYGKNPEIEACLEMGHDETFEIGVDSEEFERLEFDKWIKKQEYSRSEVYMLMNKLAFDGHIENGDYLIKTY